MLMKDVDERCEPPLGYVIEQSEAIIALLVISRQLHYLLS
jgi:hypothetical protein